MKRKSLSIFLMAATMFMILGLGVSAPEASTYLGEVTWKAANADGQFTIKAGLSKIGGNYYEIVGQCPNPPGGGRVIFSGGGVLVNTTLFATLTLTNVNSNGKWVGVMRVTINTTTFNGNFWTAEPIVYIPNGDDRLTSWSDPFPQGTYPQGYILESHLYSLGNAPTTGTLRLSGPKPDFPGQ
ncbi:MAG: hypothetical protein C4567_10575 [Deltaproteobacteria bacterium]|nr:MAG: hypothetical protein C4567_10575 [Deltaproteobacteria bacterium]